MTIYAGAATPDTGARITTDRRLERICEHRLLAYRKSSMTNLPVTALIPSAVCAL